MVSHRLALLIVAKEIPNEIPNCVSKIEAQHKRYYILKVTAKILQSFNEIITDLIFFCQQ